MGSERRGDRTVEHYLLRAAAAPATARAVLRSWSKGFKSRHGGPVGSCRPPDLQGSDRPQMEKHGSRETTRHPYAGLLRLDREQRAPRLSTDLTSHELARVGGQPLQAAVAPLVTLGFVHVLHE